MARPLLYGAAMMTRWIAALVFVVGACSGDATPPGPDAATQHETGVDAQGQVATCHRATGDFSCPGSPDGACLIDTAYCLQNSTTFGSTCKGTGDNPNDSQAPCPTCDELLALARNTHVCGDATPSCSGDETVGVTITCSSN
jgi:hypothetical protein